MDSRDLDSALRAEADALLEQHGLIGIFGDYGELYIGGSYALELMTWRDLDLYIRARELPVERFLELGARVGARLSPRRMSFKNHRDFPATEPTAGLYWGIRLGDVSAGAWKIDLWALDDATWTAQVEKTANFKAQLSDDQRATILTLKCEIWRHPEYRKTITSQDLYDSVTARGVRTVEEFWRLMAREADSLPD